MKKRSKNDLALMGLQMLKEGKDRRDVKRFFTAHRINARKAITLLCKQEMVLIRAEHLRQQQ
ncbi:hypothetical protein HB976_01235 [Yersinia mollaretii]|uniref:Uncharacterized protein n=1 Tax=Yersinia mollaretii TaxID=33060 RepID=A0AA36LJM6_YERMO|nr:hypothetical protein [Yersinia mollaretii]MDA5527340.1 hypothetical protein [Yersinia mollaretii]MDA5533653.1 hypothetical protein [Yersinia mollaretii]MDR7874666.1 hypothetical protein [Yersinia mollaretii]NIL01586.1 hypothetical protein [Yersinia mollaretii]PHZ31516.1 hypothetical protein CS537_10815 [Yersinia mollaretii]